MAEPFDSATFLEDVSAIAQTQYFGEFTEEWPSRFGTTTNKLFTPDSKEITGTGKTMQIELAPADNIRMNSDPLGDFASPDTLEPGSITVRFNKQTASSNDFTEMSASIQVDDIDVQEAGKGSIVDYVDRVYRSVVPNYDERLAVARHIGRSAVLAYVNGTPKQNDREYFSGCAATPTNSTGLRVPVDNGSIAYFKRGDRISFLTTAGVARVNNVRVTDVNTSDLSIGVEFVSTGITARISSNGSGSLATVADNDYIVRANPGTSSNEYNKGLYSMGAYFARPTSTSDSFIGGVNRTSDDYRWLLPTATREGATATKITKSMFNDMAIAMGFKSEDEMLGMVFMTDPTLHQALRDEIGEDAFIQIPVSDERMKRFMNFGSVGLNYQHGQFGTVKILSDPLCVPNQVRIIASNTWKALYYGWRGLRPVKEGSAHWYRMNQSTPNSGRGKIWKADWYSLQCDWCTKPWLNGQILNVTAT